MVAILYLKVNLLRKNSKQYHTRQNARKPRKTAKNKHYLTTVKNTVKPLINRVIQQPRWRRNAPNRQTRPARDSTAYMPTPQAQENAAPRPQSRGQDDAQKDSAKRYDIRGSSTRRSRSASVRATSPHGTRPSRSFFSRNSLRYAPSDSPRS